VLLHKKQIENIRIFPSTCCFTSQF